MSKPYLVTLCYECRVIVEAESERDAIDSARWDWNRAEDVGSWATSTFTLSLKPYEEERVPYDAE